MPAHNVCPGLSLAQHTLQRLSHAALQPLIVTPVPLQPCDWTQSPELIGSVVQVLPQSPLEEDYPFDCASGMVGSADGAGQMSARCAGACPEAHFCPTARTMEPLLCRPGSFCPLGSSMPTPCPEGHFGEESGLSAAAQCITCPDGAWCSAGIEIPCEVGFFSNGSLPPEHRTSQTVCLPCPAFSTTAAQGSATITLCLCKEGYYTRQADGLVHGGRDCVQCPPGTDCDTIGLKMQDLPLKPGWWRASNTSVDIQRCEDHGADKGSGCIGGPNAALRGCKPSLKGPFCVLCKAGAGHYFDSDYRECRECGPSTRYLTIIVALCIAVVLALASGVLMHYCSLPMAKACKPKRRRLLQVWEALRSLMVKVSNSACQACAELSDSRA